MFFTSAHNLRGPECEVRREQLCSQLQDKVEVVNYLHPFTNMQTKIIKKFTFSALSANKLLTCDLHPVPVKFAPYHITMHS